MLTKIKERLNCMFLSKEQKIYLANMFFQCVIYGSFEPTWSYQTNALGTRIRSVTLILSCVCSMLYSWFSCDIKKKAWIFKHFKTIDVCESIFRTLVDLSFLSFYFIKGYNANVDMQSVLWIFFYWNLFSKFINSIINTILPGIGDVFEQNLYKNSIIYQNHCNGERLMSTVGAVFGAFLGFLIGDFFKFHPWLTWCLVIFDWVDFWSRWQFYFNKENYKIIKANFEKDIADFEKGKKK